MRGEGNRKDKEKKERGATHKGKDGKNERIIAIKKNQQIMNEAA